jgi:hypothetical protein
MEVFALIQRSDNEFWLSYRDLKSRVKAHAHIFKKTEYWLRLKDLNMEVFASLQRFKQRYPVRSRIFTCSIGSSPEI